MDYIQQAIEKARQKREGNMGRAPAQEREPAILDTELPRRRSRKAAEPSPESIEYTSTKIYDVPKEVLREHRIIADSNDKTSEVYRQLRTQVLQKLRTNNWKTLAITSPGEDQGKTVTALNLAISLSREVNQTVMLVDLDLYSPSVSPTLEIEPDYGLIDHLKDGVPVEELLINPGFERLVILPAKDDERYSSELLSSPKMKALLKEITTRYESRLIIFDLPALLVNDDALAFTPFADAALMVVEDGANSPEDVERCLHLLEGTNLLGTVLNKAE